MESLKKEWNGDEDLTDGKLQALRDEYSKRLNYRNTDGNELINILNDDNKLLIDGLQNAITKYKAKSTAPGTAQTSIMNLSWDVAEYNILLQQCQNFIQCNRISNEMLYNEYVKNLFKKKRTAATHVLVIMISDEERKKKPYAMPIFYAPYSTLNEEKIRTILNKVKKDLVQCGLPVIGAYICFISH